MKNKIFWIGFAVCCIALSTVLVVYQTGLRDAHMETIYPYADGYKDCLLKANELLKNVTGDNLRSDVWNLRLVEENLKMCAYYAQTWVNRAGFINRDDFNLEGYFLRDNINIYRNPTRLDPKTQQPYDPRPTVEELKADFVVHSQNGARLLFDDYEENYAYYAELFGWSGDLSAGVK